MFRLTQADGRYDQNFYRDQIDVSRRSADVVVPHLAALIDPRSVVDVGCGVGTWMASWVDHGVADVAGLDGSGAESGLLQVAPSLVHTVDLASSFGDDRRFDLAMTLEVAEHLPESAAGLFVERLTELSDVVVFSAAVPGQGGTGHLNERWQSWWAQKFSALGYLAYDVVRPLVWSEPEVASYYAQNIIIYANDVGRRRSPGLVDVTAATPMDLIHPRLFERKIAHPVLRAVADALPERAKNAMTRRLRGSDFFRNV